MERPSRWFWLACFGLVTAWALLYLQYRVFEDLAAGYPGTLPRRLVDELVGGYAAFALLPIEAAVIRRFPLRRGQLVRSVPAHLIALLAISLVHTCAIGVVHTAVYPVIGLPADRYDAAPAARALQELGHDVIGYVAFVAFYLSWSSLRARRARELAHAQLERALVDAQLRALRLQLQPHFLYNTLNTISDAVYGDPRVAEAMIQDLAELLRLTLRATPGHEVTLADELDLLARYTAIMRARFGDQLQIRIDASPAATRALVPPLLLQPLVENVIQHAMTGARLDIELQAQIAGSELVIEVLDNGPGAADGVEVMQRGLGLASTAERLRLLHQGGAELTAQNRREGGFCVRLRLPAREAA